MRSSPPPARYNEPRCNEVLRITDGCSYPSNSKIYELQEPRYDETSSKRTYFVNGLLILPILWSFVTSKFYYNILNIPARSLETHFPLVFFILNHKRHASGVWDNSCYHGYKQMSWMYLHRIKYTGNNLIVHRLFTKLRKGSQYSQPKLEI